MVGNHHLKYRTVPLRAVRLIWTAAFVCLGCVGVVAQVTELDARHPFKKQSREWESASEFVSIPAQNKLFTSSKAWAEFWKTAGVPAPAVDFSTNCVVAVFGGQKPSAGFVVEIVKVSLDASRNSLVVEFIERKPGAGSGQASVMTHPHDIVVLPRPKNLEKVEFIRRPDGIRK
jgi:hypothetical protein